MFALGLIGTTIALTWKGWRSAIGFALGTVFSFLNFRFLKLLADSVGGAITPEHRRTLIIFLVGRYALFGAAGYAILRYSEVSFMAALAGCFVSIAAVFLELIYELIYAGT